MKKMIWSRLKNNKCPACNSFLKDIGEYYACSKRGCVFSVSKRRFDAMINEMYAPRPARAPLDNIETLNNEIF